MVLFDATPAFKLGPGYQRLPTYEDGFYVALSHNTTPAAYLKSMRLELDRMAPGLTKWRKSCVMVTSEFAPCTIRLGQRIHIAVCSHPLPFRLPQLETCHDSSIGGSLQQVLRAFLSASESPQGGYVIAELRGLWEE